MSARVSQQAIDRAAPRVALQRWLALDVFRGVAVLLMIQGHTFTVLARDADIERLCGKAYALLHGLTAPMFLFGAGLAYGLVTLRRGRGGAPDPRLLRRGVLLIALGYALQVPRIPLAQLNAQRDLLAGAASVGPLQLVGACLLLCETVRAFSRTRAIRLALTALLAALVTACAPFVWKAHATAELSLWFASWLDGYASSQFPLFPWAVFFLLGVLIAAPVLTALTGAGPAAARNRRLGTRFMLAGLASAGLAYALFLNGWVLRSVYGAHELWHTNPLYLLFRSGVVLLWLGVLCRLEPLIARGFARARSLAQLFGALAKQSLVAYVTHLLLLYGSPITIGLRFIGRLDLLPTAALFGGVLALTTAIAVLWQHYVTSGALVAAVAALARARLGLGARDVHRVGERERLAASAPEQGFEPAPAARDGV